MRFFLILFTLVSTLTMGQVLTAFENSEIEEKIAWLQARLSKNYWGKDQKFFFPFKWEHQKGIFKSSVHFNYIDKRNGRSAALIRQKQGVDDLNMFVTSFCLYGLLEAQQLGTVKISEHQISESLMAISKYRDRNTPDGIPQYAFWPQAKINGTWTAAPTNLVNPINLLPNLGPGITSFLENIGFGILADAKTVVKFFIIPADNDDSSVNLALLGLLKETNSPHFAFWNSFSSKKQEYYNRVLKYAYRPFGPRLDLNPHGDEIDPRTYFVLREFLNKKKSESQNPSLILPTTWLLSQSQNVKDLLQMPFNVNNVDASVCANFLFGLVYQALSQEINIEDQPELSQMALNTVELIQFTIEDILSKRPTLILVYYPSKYDFYWFCARTVQLLKRHQASLAGTLLEIKVRMEALMKSVATPQIQKSAKVEAGVDLDTLYWVEFLGNYGGKQRNEDAIFSTSLALNALLDTWTLRNGQTLSYDSDTPKQVKLVIQKAVAYLMKHLKPGMTELNAFFSGSVKNPFSTYPAVFPANRAQDGNGTEIDPTNLTLKNLTIDTTTKMKGYVSAEEYEVMLSKKWFGVDVPQQEVSMNSGKGFMFPFWSSEAFGEIMCITALSKFMRAQEEQQA